MKREKHTIDATGKSLGRLATEVAVLLRGKNRPDFTPNRDKGAFVIINNIDKVKLTGKKLENKKYYHHTGYLGSLKSKPLKEVFETEPGEVLKKAVWGMLPKNKLRKAQIKRLKVE